MKLPREAGNRKKPYRKPGAFAQFRKRTHMCELKVVVKDEVVFEDAIYAKVEGAKVTVRDVLGVTKVFNNYEIAEVDVNKERLLLRQIDK